MTCGHRFVIEASVTWVPKPAARLQTGKAKPQVPLGRSYHRATKCLRGRRYKESKGQWSNISSVVQTHLRLFDSEAIRKATDTTTMDLDAFVAGKPMSLYLIVPPFRLTAYRPLLRLWLAGLILLLTQGKPPPKERTLMLCDEVGNLGRIDALLTVATLLRSWGLTLWSFWQNAGNFRFTAHRRTRLRTMPASFRYSG